MLWNMYFMPWNIYFMTWNRNFTANKKLFHCTEKSISAVSENFYRMNHFGYLPNIPQNPKNKHRYSSAILVKRRHKNGNNKGNILT